MMIGGLHKDATDLSHRLAALDNLLKGYPEYNPDQSRGEDGKWTGGSASTGAARGRAARAKTPGERKPRGPTLRQRYEQRFGHPPPKTMSRYAMERWIKGPTKTAPSPDGHQPTKGELSDVSRRMRDLANSSTNAQRSNEERQRQIARDALDLRDEMKGWNEGVWKDPTFADMVWDTLTSLNVIFPVMAAGAIGGSVGSAVMGVWTGSVALTGTYLMLRYAYRKLTTVGAYRGVRKPDSYQDIFHG